MYPRQKFSHSTGFYVYEPERSELVAIETRGEGSAEPGEIVQMPQIVTPDEARRYKQSYDGPCRDACRRHTAIRPQARSTHFPLPQGIGQ